MTKEQIIEQIEKSFSGYQGTNEAIDDAAFYIEAAFNKLQGKRDSQGLLINTDVDDTMRQPLSDEEIKQKLSVIISSSNSGNEKLESILELFKHRPNEWVRLNKDRQVDYIGLAAMFIKREDIESIVTANIANSIPYYYCTHWMPITLPTPPTK